MFPATARALLAAQDYSLRTLDDLRRQLELHLADATAVRCVAVTGSLARHEAAPGSDADLIVVLHGESLADRQSAAESMERVQAAVAATELEASSDHGIYAVPTSFDQLCDAPRGVVDEAIEIFGKRIALLLETAPAWRESEVHALQRGVLRWYHSGVQHDPWCDLRDDLTRYWKSYRVWRRAGAVPETGAWRARQVKLEHSRLISYISLWFALAELGDPVADAGMELLEWVRLTPWQRLTELAGRLEQQSAFRDLVAAYDHFLGQLQQSRAEGSDLAQWLQQTSTWEGLLASREQLQAALLQLAWARPESQRRHLLKWLLM